MTSPAHLRNTFDEVALLYDRVRPGYPDALYGDIAQLSGVGPGGRVLEIGCGTGQATVPLARRGYRILAVELGENLAAVARYNLRDYPEARVVTGAFEAWPLEEGAFDLVVSATAFHWLDPTVAFPKVARALMPGGSIALFWNFHVHSGADRGFFNMAQEVYQREAPELWREEDHPLPKADEVPETVRREIEETRLFGPVTVRRYPWEATYDAATYIAVLDTYSGHRSLDARKRERLFRGIAEMIDTRFGGRIVKGYLAMLYLANRL
jgi:SAM-dependent methyltransferase